MKNRFIACVVVLFVSWNCFAQEYRTPGNATESKHRFTISTNIAANNLGTLTCTNKCGEVVRPSVVALEFGTTVNTNTLSLYRIRTTTRALYLPNVITTNWAGTVITDYVHQVTGTVSVVTTSTLASVVSSLASTIILSDLGCTKDGGVTSNNVVIPKLDLWDYDVFKTTWTFTNSAVHLDLTFDRW